MTPDLIKALPAPIRTLIIESYNEALIPIFMYMVPLAVITVVLLCFIKEVPLSTSIEAEILPESLAEGQLLAPDESEPTKRDSPRRP